MKISVSIICKIVLLYAEDVKDFSTVLDLRHLFASLEMQISQRALIKYGGNLNVMSSAVTLFKVGAKETITMQHRIALFSVIVRFC